MRDCQKFVATGIIRAMNNVRLKYRRIAVHIVALKVIYPILMDELCCRRDSIVYDA